MTILQELDTKEAQYDAHVKRILSNHYVLAWILKNTTEEFKEVSIKQIAEECIAGDISISRIKVMPGQTNAEAEENEDTENGRNISGEDDAKGKGREQKRPERILGMNTEDKVPGEGAIYYDIRFSAYAPGKTEATKILLNLEAQKSFYEKYALVTRGIFYGARMISAQLDTEFTAENYSDMKKVYSIWICMNAPNYIGNAVTEYSITKKDIIGIIPDIKEDYDKMSVLMIYLNGTKKGRDKGDGFVRLLNILLTPDMTAEEKGKILTEEYEIETKDDFEEEINCMCNLGEGIREEALEEGIEQGRTQGEAQKLIEQVCKKLKKGKIPNTIAEELEENLEKIQSICEIAEPFAPSYALDEVYKAWYMLTINDTAQ